MILSNFFRILIIFLTISIEIFAQHSQDIANRHSARAAFKSKYGNVWDIRWNPKTETPSTIIGGQITKYKGSSLDIAKAFLNEEKIMLGINNIEKELSLTKVNTSERGGSRYIFSQVVNGITVIGSGYIVAVADDGSIYFVSGDYYPNLLIDTTPSLSPNLIIDIIRKDLNNLQDLEISYPQLLILPEETNSVFKYKLVYISDITSEKPLTAFRYTIDANSGDILFKDELIDKINGTGKVYQTNPDNGTTVTRTIHRLHDISPRKLDGDNVIVYNDDGDEASSSTATFEYSSTNTHFDEVMAYYHSDEFENWLISLGMGSGKVGKFEVHTHNSYYYAATNSISRIMYLSDGISGLENPSHEAAIICHEYMHGVSQTYNTLDHTPGSQHEDAMDEAYSDYFAVNYSSQFVYSSIIGSYIDKLGGLVYQRNLNNSWTMSDYNTIDLEPDSITQHHDRSVIFSGALWNFRNNTNVDPTLANELILESLNNLDDSPDFLDGRDALIAADILNNHGCYVNIIKNAFYLKEIGTDAESVTTSGTLQNNETWYCTQTLQGNVIVPTGKTLTISSVATVNLNGHSIISTGGTINKQSGATINGMRARLTANLDLRGLCGRIQTAANYAGTTNEIWIQNGDFYEDVTIYNVYALRLDGASEYYNHFGHLNLINCDHFEGYEFGAERISVSNADVAWFYYVSAYESDHPGFYINYSDDVELNYCQATSSWSGITSYSSEADVTYSYLWENDYGVQSYNGNDITLSYTSFCGTALDLKTYNFSSIYTFYCSFDGGTPSTSGSSIYTSSNSSCGTAKLALPQQSDGDNYQFVMGEDITSNTAFGKINSEYFSINKELRNAYKSKTTFNKEELCIEYEDIISDFNNFIDNNPDSPMAQNALRKITRCYERIDNLRGINIGIAMKNFLINIIENKAHASLTPTAERLLINYYSEIKDYSKAIELSNNLIEKYKSDDDYVCDVLYARGLILLHNLKNSAEAEACFKTILKNYPDHPLANLAEYQLQDLGYSKEQIELEKSITAQPKELSIGNSPNPFNPVTTIQYDLPKDVNVVLEVYNVQGQKIKTLVDSYQKAGSYDVQFDGTKLASGVYIYKIKAGEYSISKRMLLIK